jgi:hypothetical protein
MKKKHVSEVILYKKLPRVANPGLEIQNVDVVYIKSSFAHMYLLYVFL